MTHSPPPDEPIRMSYEDVKQMIEKDGWKLVDGGLTPRLHLLSLSLRHLLFGCQKIHHGIWDPASQRVVHVGMICSVCNKEYPQ